MLDISNRRQFVLFLYNRMPYYYYKIIHICTSQIFKSLKSSPKNFKTQKQIIKESLTGYLQQILSLKISDLNDYLNALN